MIGDLPFSVHLARTDSNHGPAAARNLGWRTATTPLLAYLDDDVTPSPGWLEAGLAALAAHPEAGVIQGWTYTPADVNLKGITWGPPNWQVLHTIVGPSPYFEACNIFYRRPAFEATGGFDEHIGWWGEDTASGWNVLEAGWERGFAARCCGHAPGGTAGLRVVRAQRPEGGQHGPPRGRAPPIP